jgi:dTMP kinase
LLFAADRADHLARTVEPALARGQTVVSDRYDLSSMAYQSATSGQGEDVLEWIRQLNSRALRPDLTLVIDVSAETALRRRQLRGGSAELFEVPDLQRRLSEIYRRAEDLVPADPVVHIDGEAESDIVSQGIWVAVDPLEFGSFS